MPDATPNQPATAGLDTRPASWFTGAWTRARALLSSLGRSRPAPALLLTCFACYHRGTSSRARWLLGYSSARGGASGDLWLVMTLGAATGECPEPLPCVRSGRFALPSCIWHSANIPGWSCISRPVLSRARDGAHESDVWADRVLLRQHGGMTRAGGGGLLQGSRRRCRVMRGRSTYPRFHARRLNDDSVRTAGALDAQPLASWPRA